jgi:hypothetical protein
MKTHGSKIIDPISETRVLDWLLVPAGECPDAVSETKIATRYFRTPHPSSGLLRAFVRPVEVRRSRRRVLFCQELGIDL